MRNYNFYARESNPGASICRGALAFILAQM
jgi:hypothetical protein